MFGLMVEGYFPDCIRSYLIFLVIQQTLELVNLDRNADNKINVSKMFRIVLNRVESIVKVEDRRKY